MSKYCQSLKVTIPTGLIEVQVLVDIIHMNFACPKKSICEAACLGREVLVVENYQIQPAKTTQEGRIHVVLNEALEDNKQIFQKLSNLASFHLYFSWTSSSNYSMHISSLQLLLLHHCSHCKNLGKA